MNKYIFIAILIAVAVIAPAAYYAFILPAETEPAPRTGITREVTITAQAGQWKFEPETIEVNRGDTVVITAMNNDNFDHGFAIDAYGVSERIPAGESVKIEFVADQEGDFPYYCSIPCGSGLIHDERRSHFDMMGMMHVRSMISSAQ